MTKTEKVIKLMELSGMIKRINADFEIIKNPLGGPVIELLELDQETKKEVIELFAEEFGKPLSDDWIDRAIILLEKPEGKKCLGLMHLARTSHTVKKKILDKKLKKLRHKFITVMPQSKNIH